MDKNVLKIYCKMFPETRGDLPAFSNIDTTGLLEKFDATQVINNLIADQKIDLDDIEINAFLKLFKKESYEIANGFIEVAISFYFSHPQVLSMLQGGRITLFPHYRAMPEINYDLLIPVVEMDI